MFRNVTHANSISKQRGSSLVMAIFIVVVISLLGAVLMRMSSSSAETFAYEVLGTRAFSAAKTGIAWQLKQIFPLNSDAQNCSAFSVTGFPNLSNIDGFKQCRISKVSCLSFIHQSVTYYKVTSTGQCDINGETTSRTIEVEARSM